MGTSISNMGWWKTIGFSSLSKPCQSIVTGIDTDNTVVKYTVEEVYCDGPQCRFSVPLCGGLDLTQPHMMHLRFPKITSTQTWVADNLSLLRDEYGLGRSRHPQWVAISAGEQSAGIGTTDTRTHLPREWISNPNNVCVTFVIPWPESKNDLLFNFAQVATVATSRTLESFGLSPSIKWINDVQINGKKISGVLSAYPSFQICSTPNGEALNAVLVGVGINMFLSNEKAEQIQQPVTSLHLELHEKPPPATYHALLNEVMSVLFSQMFHNFNILRVDGFPPFLGYVVDRLTRKGEVVEMHEDCKVTRGTLVGLNPDGSLLLQLEDRSLKTFTTGKIV